jgi:hypothetical protein
MMCDLYVSIGEDKKMKITRVHTTILPAQRLIALALVLALALAACGNQGTPAEPASTPTPVADAPEPTGTPAPTSTPQPTSTPTSLPTETPAPTPTDTSTPTPDAAATEQALATQQADQIVATIAPQLEKLGLSVEDGYLAWFSTQPEEIRVFDYIATKFSEIGENLNLGDFILFTDITWESTEGFTTCGVIFRAEPEITKGEYYLFQVLRLSGLPGWDIEFWDGKQPVVNVSDHLQTDKTINQDQGATNSYMLVVQGDKMTVYANGARLRTQYDKRRAEGLPAFYAWQNSGESTCTFSNGWIWALK